MNSGLLRIYELFDELVGDYPLACEKGCVACCTDRVVLTSAEARLILDYLERTGQRDLLEKLPPAGRSYTPPTTMNGLARVCMEGGDLPEEPEDLEPGACPLLGEDGACPVYPVRPFACRALVSKTKCEAGGAARMDPFWITQNELFMQWIEHMDQGGFSGNLADMLLGLVGESATGTMLANEPIPGLFAPPEERDRLMEVVRLLREVQTG
ncbi:MAG: YkgJ family cysteine cluster protein [Desulfatibacillaceae bacterium]